MIISASFDPITAAELTALKKIRKEKKLKDLYVYVNEEGILDQSLRIKMVQRALTPYSHLHCISSNSDAIALEGYAEDEKRVREGFFVYAAPGIHKMLCESNAYLEQIADAQCNPHRAKHSIGVAETAQELAHVYHMDEQFAYKMGMLHDITKKMPHEESMQIIQRYRPEWLSIAEPVWHSYTAVIWLKQNMSCYDSELLHAIEHHTLGDGNSLYDQILYIADKIEPNRGYDTSFEKKLACKDLKACTELIKEEANAYRKKKAEES